MIGWLSDSAPAVPEGDGWLGHGEAAAATLLRSPRRRADWRLGRWVARRILAAAGVDIHAVEVRAAGDGAPEVWRGGIRLPLTLSISHRDGVGTAALAAPPQPVGCDVEVIERRPAVFVADWFTPTEHALCERCPADERDVAVTVVWSAKESALKALRCGLRRDTRSVEVVTPALFGTCGWHRLWVHDAEGGGWMDGWWRRDGRLVTTVVAARMDSPPTDLRSCACRVPWRHESRRRPGGRPDEEPRTRMMEARQWRAS